MRKVLTLSLAALALSVGVAGTAKAEFVSGVFSVEIYNFVPAGNNAERRDNSDATEENVAENALDFSLTYTGDLNFETTGSDTTILDFLLSGGGSLSNIEDGGGSTVPQSDLDILATASNFMRTTLYVFEWTAPLTLEDGLIEHDDGISLFDDGSLVSPVGAEEPTTEIDSIIPTILAGSDLRLIYSAANGNPEVLQFTATVVPIPAALPMLLAAAGGLGFAGWRHRKASA